jgi:hypothetical protein
VKFREPWFVALLGMLCLIAGQCLASFAIKPLRGTTVSAKELYTAVQPGEFAGTLLLGGIRGLACDLLWMRGCAAKDSHRFYESVAIFQAISRIQPRFEQVWEYMTHDMAYNIAVEVNDEDGKWSWFLAGVDANVRGCRRNPGSERLLRHLAWVFFHKGDTFHQRILTAEWAPLLNPLIAELNDRQLAELRQIPLLPTGSGLSNFQLAARLYDAAIAVAVNEGKRPPAFVRRMIPHAIEKDGNLWRNQGEHFRALQRYVDALEAWSQLLEWLHMRVSDQDELYDRAISLEPIERNEGRLRRKTAELARILAPDQSAGEIAAEAILARDFASMRKLLRQPGWKSSSFHGGITWLDEQ